MASPGEFTSGTHDAELLQALDQPAFVLILRENLQEGEDGQISPNRAKRR